MSRREIPFAAAASAVVLLALASCAGTAGPAAPFVPLLEPGTWNGSPVVTTRYGMVGGVEDADDTYLWRAIPYAAP